MTPEQTRQVEQLARKLCCEDGHDPNGVLRAWNSDLTGYVLRIAWEYYEKQAAEQLGFVRGKG